MTRCRPNDVLSIMCFELIRDGMALKPWDCDARTAWIAQCKQLLEATPDPIQRLAWRMYLAESVAATMDGCPVAQMMEALL